MIAYFKEALSEEGNVSSKRVIAFMAFIAAVIVFGVNVAFPELHIEYKNYFDTLLFFSGALLGFTTAEKFKIATPPNTPNQSQ